MEAILFQATTWLVPKSMGASRRNVPFPKESASQHEFPTSSEMECLQIKFRKTWDGLSQNAVAGSQMLGKLIKADLIVMPKIQGNLGFLP